MNVVLLTNRKALYIALAALALVAVAVLALVSRNGAETADQGSPPAGRAGASGENWEHAEGEAGEVELSAEALAAAKIEIGSVTQRAAVGLLRVTGTVEANQQQTQSVTPLVSGRVEHVAVELGDAVRAGSVLAVIVSPEIAQMHGKLHEAETRVALAERNYDRVIRAENRAAVLTAKARLDEAEATLRRTRRLVELGAGAGKDLVAAETAYKTAKADYDFQSNIALNREVQEAKAELETARVDASHTESELAALGGTAEQGHRAHDEGSARLVLRAPAAGVVTERLVNSGAGVQAGQSLFTISNLSTVWVIANVPEGQVNRLLVGSTAEVRTPAGGDAPVEGRVAYVDPRLDEATRTARVRVEVANPGGRLKTGMFVEVGFQAGAPGSDSPEAQELVVPSTAVERLGERTVVFLPKTAEPGHFEVRDVEVGGEVDGYKRVVAGLELGEKVVTKGTFTLKTQLAKGEIGEHDH